LHFELTFGGTSERRAAHSLSIYPHWCCDNIALAADSADNRRFAGADATGAAASAAVPRQSS
jgi:hypothetical protein